jgi:hypothetical protein
MGLRTLKRPGDITVIHRQQSKSPLRLMRTRRRRAASARHVEMIWVQHSWMPTSTCATSAGIIRRLFSQSCKHQPDIGGKRARSSGFFPARNLAALTETRGNRSRRDRARLPPHALPKTCCRAPRSQYRRQRWLGFHLPGPAMAA